MQYGEAHSQSIKILKMGRMPAVQHFNVEQLKGFSHKKQIVIILGIGRATVHELNNK